MPERQHIAVIFVFQNAVVLLHVISFRHSSQIVLSTCARCTFSKSASVSPYCRYLFVDDFKFMFQKSHAQNRVSVIISPSVLIPPALFLANLQFIRCRTTLNFCHSFPVPKYLYLRNISMVGHFRCRRITFLFHHILVVQPP